MSSLLAPPSFSLPDRLRRGDAAALLELAHATHGRALAVVRAAGWTGRGNDPEALLLDAYVALYFRRAEAPDDGAEAWALAEVLSYCERRGSAARETPRRRETRRGATLGARVGARMRAAVRGVVRSVTHAPAVGGSAS